ncbi:SRPBCC family protein [Gemmobacter serpentinus]|uniref:SRPBCC family protein n=1 Tax=Gemmobacter serpentinus TaxID=2652247 RepID=UPI00124D1D5B|nr:SRPBCC family protein [Gemmobacter serpentinus]
MKLSTREDIEAPLAFVFDSFADTEGWERAALRRGAEVTRTDRLQGFGPGMAWNVGFLYRGKMRRISVKLAAVDKPNALTFQGFGKMVDAEVKVDFVEMSARRTRVTLGVEVKPRNLAARVFLQSMKLARGKIDRKFEARVGALCNEIEERYRAQARA